MVRHSRSSKSRVRFSEYFGLDKTQAELDFVDVDLKHDTRVFVNPSAIRQIQSEWGSECVYLIQNFFSVVLECIRSGRNAEAERLLRNLKEPNETRLGLSEAAPRGRALGQESAHDVWEALKDSEAVRTGLLRDLEDTVLMVDGISVDKISDITTNIIRGPLIAYTQNMCAMHGVPMSNVDSGPVWIPQMKTWRSDFCKLPVYEGKKILLVPKAIVRLDQDYSVREYLTHYLLEKLKAIELSANSELVQLLIDGTPVVRKKRLIAKYGFNKHTAVTQTLNHPEILEEYRKDKLDDPSKMLGHTTFAELSGEANPDWPLLFSKISKIHPGRETADQYEKAVEGLLTALFYPSLINPIQQHEIHQGRKRIDITYTNMGRIGFFEWLSRHYAAPYIFVECKNYGAEIGNPEIDQIAGRFSPSRGKVGLLICRKIANRDLLTTRCIDTAKDQRGYILALDDSDLAQLVRDREGHVGNFPLLERRFRELVE